MEKAYDVVVIGTGTWGAATLWHLAKRGLKVLGIDKYEPPHQHGSHSGETRLFRQSNSSGPEYTELTVRALEQWNQVAREADSTFLTKTGTIFTGAQGSSWFDKTLENLEESEFTYYLLKPAQAMEEFPGLSVPAEETVIWEPNGLVARVPVAIRCLLKVARNAGAEIRLNQPLLNWHSTDEGVEVSVPDGKILARNLIFTTGAWSKEVTGVDIPAKVERQILFNFETKPFVLSLPSVYFAAPPGSDDSPAYGCPEPDGTYKVSVATRGFEVTPENFDQSLQPGDLELVLDIVKERLPGLELKPKIHSICLWSESADGHWVIGRHPADPRVVYGAACTGRGFRYAPAIGELLADLSQGKDNGLAARFSLDRFAA